MSGVVIPFEQRTDRDDRQRREALLDESRALAEAIASQCAEQSGFALFMFDDGGSCVFVSNHERELVIKAVRSWLKRQERTGG